MLKQISMRMCTPTRDIRHNTLSWFKQQYGPTVLTINQVASEN